MSSDKQWVAQPQFSGAQVLVVGDVMLDRYWHGATARISPEAPVPVVQVQQREDRAGGAGNVALNIAALGGGVSLLGLVGADEEARVLEQRLQAAQVHCNFEKIATRPTITKLRVISRHQQLLRMDFEESFSAQDSAALAARATAVSTCGCDRIVRLQQRCIARSAGDDCRSESGKKNGVGGSKRHGFFALSRCDFAHT